MGSLGCALRPSSSFRFAWVYSSGARCSRVNTGSLGFTRALLGIVGHIGVRVGSLVRS